MEYVFSPSILSKSCSSFTVPSVVTAKDCVSPRVKSALPCVQGRTPTSHVIGLISVTFLPSVLTPSLRIEARRMLYSISSNIFITRSYLFGSASIISLNFSITSWWTLFRALPLFILPLTKDASFSRGYAYSLIGSIQERSSSLISIKGSFSFPQSSLIFV